MIVFLVLASFAALIGCHPAYNPPPDLKIESEFIPPSPRVGLTTVALRVHDTAGEPVKGAEVTLEGVMSHPGMAPVFGNATEQGSGRYEGRLDFTMQGDWVILLHIKLSDGRKMERQLEAKAVRAK